MNEELGKPIATGRTAEIYAWGDGQVLKLFYDWFGLDAIRYEQRIHRAVHSSGLAVPAVGEIIPVNGRNGLVYQRIEGISMLELFAKQPWRVLQFADCLAELHAQMHALSLPADLPSLRGQLSERIQHAPALPPRLRSQALHALEGLPEGGCICHGDFHPGNILVSPRGETIIDWIDAARGNPLADVARTSVLLLGAAAAGQVPGTAMSVLVRLTHARYLRRYFQLRPGGEAEYRRWLPVVAAARLDEGIPELESWLLAQIQQGV